MELLQSLLAAFIGTGLMSRSSFTEMYWEGRPASVVPGQATNQILKIFGVPEIEGRGLQILSDYMHWILGVSWGVVFYLLVGVADLNLGVAGVLFFLIVWGSEQIYLPLLGLGIPWPWKWGKVEGQPYNWKYNLSDMFHHLVYAWGTVLGYWLIGLTHP